MSQRDVFMALGGLSLLVLCVGITIWAVNRWRYHMNEVAKLYRELTHQWVHDNNCHPNGDVLDQLWKQARKQYKNRKTS